MTKKIHYKRILLKLSGEIFGDAQNRGLNFVEIDKMAHYLHDLKEKYPIEIALVIGGGNLFRGRDGHHTAGNKATLDHIGMLATIMNGLALQEAIEKYGSITRVMSSFLIQAVCEPFVHRKAIRHLEKGRIVILVGGTGNPFFTTDSAAALRAGELGCEVLLKATLVDGVYTRDPRLHKDAKLYNKVTYQEALEKRLKVMDNTAFSICQREQIPIIVFNMNDLSNIERIIRGESVGTMVSGN